MTWLSLLFCVGKLFSCCGLTKVETDWAGVQVIMYSLDTDPLFSASKLGEYVEDAEQAKIPLEQVCR